MNNDLETRIQEMEAERKRLVRAYEGVYAAYPNHVDIPYPIRQVFMAELKRQQDILDNLLDAIQTQGVK